MLSVPEKSIAVLPFENLSENKENEFFTSGMQDEILTNLAKVADLKVISRSSTMVYSAGAPRNVREIARQLGVAHVLEGSIQRSANRVRASAQLIDARADTQIWAEHYDRDVTDAFAIQTDIARSDRAPTARQALALGESRDRAAGTESRGLRSLSPGQATHHQFSRHAGLEGNATARSAVVG